MSGGDLRADTCGAVRHDRVKKADNVNAFFQHSRGEPLRLRCVANHNRDDRMHPGLDRQAAFGQGGAKIFCIFFELVAQFCRCAEKFERLQRSRDNWRRDGVGEQIWARALPQKIDNLLASTGKPAASAAERFAQRAGNDVDPAHDAAIFVCAAPGFAEETGRVRVVNHGKRVVFFSEIANPAQIRDRSIHRETAVSGDQSEPRIVRCTELRFEICHVVVLVTKPLRFAQPDAVNDAGVI